MNYKGIDMKLQVVSGEDTYRETLESKGIKTEIIKESIKVARGIGARVNCSVYKYVSPNTNETLYIYEYVEVWDGNAEIGCYVVGTTSDADLDVFELYDAVMKELKERK